MEKLILSTSLLRFRIDSPKTDIHNNKKDNFYWFHAGMLNVYSHLMLKKVS